MLSNWRSSAPDSAGLRVNYEVSLPAFQGPVELLLALIESQRLAITAISLAAVAEQYLEHVRNMPERDASELAAFLEIAARLLVIKSRALLPTDGPADQEAEDAAGDLIARLEEYRRFRSAAEWLGERLHAGHELFIRRGLPPAGPLVVCRQYSPAVLGNLALKLFARRAAEPPFEGEPGPAAVGIGVKLRVILRLLLSRSKVFFHELIHGVASRSEVLVTFLALLELVRRRRVVVSQEGLFGPISVTRYRQGDAAGSSGSLSEEQQVQPDLTMP